jgi:hypothetical protein
MSSSSEQLSAGTQLSERVEARWSVVAQDPAQPRAIAVGVVVCRVPRSPRIRHPLVPKQW